MRNDQQLQEEISTLIKKSFSKNTNLYKELKLYRAITETKSVGVLTAEKIVNEAKLQHDKLDKKELLEEQSKLTRIIKKKFSDKIYNNFVPNYKELASISQIFNNNLNIKSKVLLENELVGGMILKEEKKEMVPIDNLVFKSFVKRFNDQYGDTLMKEQKDLLTNYILSFQNNGLELNYFLNEEVTRLKQVISESKTYEEVKDDQNILENVKKVDAILSSYTQRKPDLEMIKEVLKIQELAKELQENVSNDQG
jgi:ribosomal protein S13